jgi:photosystem II stability/assembly factor-like uncharacterized protein/phosphodiesterase/alkaline phosphatase D-like protein
MDLRSKNARKNIIPLTTKTLIIVFLSFSSSIYAQLWHKYNPTLGYDVNCVEILGPGVIAIGGGWESNDSTQIMFQTTDYCQTWIENAHDGLAPWNKSMAFSDQLNGYAVGDDGNIIKSDDAGQNWGWNVHPINRSLNKIVYVSGGTYYIAGGNKTNDSIQTIIKSHNYGQTWEVIYDTLGPWLKSLYFKDTLNGFAVGDKGVILRTNNGGNSWSSVTSPIYRDFNAITFINADTGYIVGGYVAGINLKTILRTNNGGNTWTVQIDGLGGILNDISFADSKNGYIVGDSATVYKTIDGGNSWQLIVVDTNLIGNETFNAVKFYNKNFGAIAGRAGLFYMYLDKQPEAYTFGISQIGTTSATFKGGINTNHKNVRYSFVYSTSNLFVTKDTTLSVSINNDSLLVVLENITGLTPNAFYYYFIRATYDGDTITGDTLSFYTGVNPFTEFLTYEATNVMQYGAYLNGYVNKLPQSCDLYFEYGKSPAFGLVKIADPVSVIDSFGHTVQAFINGLQANKLYFFRLKGVSSLGTFYGDTKMFRAVDLPYVTTQNATTVSSTSARLNGNVSNNGFPGAVKFEYGLTALYGTEVDASPDSVFGNSNVNPNYILTGLNPLTTYHFRIKVINAKGVSYGSDKTFSVGQPNVYTYFASNTTPSSAQLNGSVNANNIPTAVTFEYGLSASYGNEIAAVPDSAFGNSNVNVSCQLTGLISNRTYYFRAKARSLAGTTYGNGFYFNTVYPFFVTTTTASLIDFSSARLNGAINTGGRQAMAKFEYGTDTLYGNEIFISTDSFSSVGNVNVFSDISGLTSNTYYHYRLKASTSNLTKTGSDMLFYTGFSEIPNFDFENWTPLVTIKPQGWNICVGSITQSFNACHGNTSVKIQNVVNQNGTQPGAILMGNTNDGGHSFIGGVPFDARPDTLIGCFDYSIESNDTALILLKLKKQGVTISENWFEIYGNSAGVFQTIKFPIEYSSAGNADTLIIAATCTDIRHMSVPPVANYLVVDHIRFSGTSLNIPNNDFEDWDSDTINVLDNWYYSNRTSGNPEHQQDFPVSKTTDAQHGDYAVLIQNFLYSNDTIRGGISTLDQNNGWSVPSFSVNARHNSLTGYYKFIQGNNDTLNFFVMMFKNHNIIGWGSFQSTTEDLNYLPFTVDIYYNSPLIPDSCVISMQPCMRNVSGNSKLYIDNLNFDGFLSGVKEEAIVKANNIDLNVYPNPFSENATIAFTLSQDEDVVVSLFDLSGKQLLEVVNGHYKSGEYNIKLSAAGLTKGFYICVINTKNKVVSKKLIIF